MIKIIQKIEIEKIKPTVVVCFHDHNNSGGTLAMIDLIDKWENDKSFNIICVFPKEKGEGLNALKKYKVGIISFPYWQCVRKGGERATKILIKYLEFFVSYCVLFYAYKKVFSKIKIDIVYSNTSVIFVGAYLSRLLQKPHIWHIRELLLPEHMIIPLFGERFHYKYIIKNANRIILISQSLRLVYEKYTEKEKIVVIYDDLVSVHPPYSYPKWELCKNNLLIAGNITPGKGQLVAIEAIRLLKEKGRFPNLFIAGIADTSCESYYNKIIKRTREFDTLGQVKVLGYIDDMFLLRKNMGIGIVASEREAFGRVTVEDMLAGMIVVGLDSGGTSELIRNGYNGFKYSENNAYELEKVLDTVLTMEEDKIEQIRANAQKEGLKYTNGDGAVKVKEIIEEEIKNWNNQVYS